MAAQASLNVVVRAQAQFAPPPGAPPQCEYYSECTGLEVGGREVAVVGHMQGLWVVDTQPVFAGTGGPITVAMPPALPDLHRAHIRVAKPAPWHDVAAYRYQPTPTVAPRHFVFGVVDSFFEPHPGLQVLEIVPGPRLRSRWRATRCGSTTR